MPGLRPVVLFCAAGLLLAGRAAPAGAQPPDPPTEPPGWTGSFGAGLALTQGNSDTSTVNVAYNLERDAGTRVLFKSVGLFIRAQSEGRRTTERLTLDTRLDYELGERLSTFGQVQYLRDEFKQIDQLVSPTLGLAYQLVESDATEFALDAGAGFVWEQNPGARLQSDGAVTAGQTFTRKLSETAEVTERLSALWKMGDFEDGLYTLAVGLAASITSRTEIKAEAVNSFKNKPARTGVRQNDVAVLLSFLYKF